MKKVRIFVVDAQQPLIECIKCVFGAHHGLEIVGGAVHWDQAEKRLKALRPDIVIMDTSMSSSGGIHELAKIQSLAPEADVIVFTMCSKWKHILEVLDLGATAYVLKRESLKQLVSAVQAVRQGEGFLSPGVQKVLSGLEGGREGESPCDERLACLSPREREVFYLLADGCTIKEVAQELAISPKTVETHKYNIMAKLKVGRLADLTKIAIKCHLIEV
ncbi:MAG: response regulator transcription factor [Deltaproteobacteria bacterium]|nr:response regulator transcription factor [Deltaproteobacteria bacterium]